MKTTKRRLEIHPFALLLPTADREDMTRLRDDIRKHGVKVPIVLFDGRILDGRSRYTAARDLRLPVPTVDFEGTVADALDLVASYNLHRRHLNQSQKAAVAARIAQELTRVNSVPKAEAQAAAAKITGASNGYVKKAAAIQERDPATAKEILEGETTIGEVIGREFRNTCPSCGHRW